MNITGSDGCSYFLSNLNLLGKSSQNMRIKLSSTTFLYNIYPLFANSVFIGQDSFSMLGSGTLRRVIKEIRYALILQAIKYSIRLDICQIIHEIGPF